MDREGKISPWELKTRVRPCLNDLCVRQHAWPNTHYGEECQRKRNYDLQAAWEYEWSTRNPGGDENFRAEALDDAESLQNEDGSRTTHGETTWKDATPCPIRGEICYKSRDQNPAEVIDRANSITSLTFAFHPGHPSPPVVAQSVQDAKDIFTFLRTTPVFGGDPKQYPLVTSLAIEDIVGTQDMKDGRHILPMNFLGPQQIPKDIPSGEYQVSGLYTPPVDPQDGFISTVSVSTTRTRQPDEFAYVYWATEHKERLGYVPNFQLMDRVPYMLLLFTPNLPVFAIPFRFFFEPDTLFRVQNDRDAYYEERDGSFFVDCTKTPSVPSPWALEELSDLRALDLQFQGQLWLVTSARETLRQLSTAFPTLTATRTSVTGAPESDSLGEATVGFPGRHPGPRSLDYIPLLSFSATPPCSAGQDYSQANISRSQERTHVS